MNLFLYIHSNVMSGDYMHETARKDHSNSRSSKNETLCEFTQFLSDPVASSFTFYDSPDLSGRPASPLSNA